MFNCLHLKNKWLLLVIASLVIYPFFVVRIAADVPGCNGEVMYCVKDCQYGFRPYPWMTCCTAEEYASGEVTCVQAPLPVAGPLDCNSVGCASGLYLSCPEGARRVGDEGDGMCLQNCPPGSFLDPTGACVLDDDPPPPVSSFGCQNCNPQYTPEGCSTNPADPNYTVDCQVSYDCSGHPTGPAPVCNTTTQWCNPDNLCTGGANSVGIGSTTRRLSPPSQKAKHPKVCIISYHLKKIVRCSPRQEVV